MKVFSNYLSSECLIECVIEKIDSYFRECDKKSFIENIIPHLYI